MRSLIARLDKLEELVGVRDTKVVLVSIAGRYDEEIRAYIGNNKSYYKREGESHSAFVKRIEGDATGMVLLRASYE